jgi:hypothetical protein
MVNKMNASQHSKNVFGFDWEFAAKLKVSERSDLTLPLKFHDFKKL